jgi:hypothetical protein
MSKFDFYAAVHKSSGFIREVKLAEDREQAEAIIMSNWTERLKSQYVVERVEVTRLATAVRPTSAAEGSGREAIEIGAPT